MNMDFAERLLANFNYEGKEKTLEMFTDDAVFEDATFGFRMEGREQLIALFDDFFDPSKMEHEFKALSYKGDDKGGAIEWSWVLRSKADFMGVPTNGQALNGRGTAVITLRDGKITSFHDYWDAAGILRQLGAIK